MNATAASIQFSPGCATLVLPVFCGQAGVIVSAGTDAGDIATQDATGMIVRY